MIDLPGVVLDNIDGKAREVDDDLMNDDHYDDDSNNVCEVTRISRLLDRLHCAW